MRTFDASLRTIGDRKGLPATLTVADGRLAIEAGDQSIGEWSLADIRLEQTPTGYRMAAEGEQLLLDIDNVDDFTQALNGRRVRGKRAKGEQPEVKSARTALPKSKRSKGESATDETATEPKTEKATKPEKSERKHVADEAVGFAAKANAFVDTTLEAASEKWGGNFPAWTFTRGTLYSVTALFAVVMIFPGVFFWMLLIAGILMVMVGAVVYTDNVAAARWLPGKMTPMHLLIYGVGLVIFAVFVGVASDNRILIALLGLVLAAGVTFAARFRSKTPA